MVQSTASKASQEFVPIKEIRDGIIVLKDGSYRAIVLASSLNFALKSHDEQASIVYQFQNFLNSLNFSVQICIQSRKLDINPYLKLLDAREKEQTSDLMKIQIKQYRDFIETLTQNTNIMTKNFFVVVPYSSTLNTTDSNPLGGLFSSKDKKVKKVQDDAVFEEHRGQLEQRVSVVEEGLTRCGIRIVELGTEELIELFYKSFNPGELDKPTLPTA